MKNQIFIQFLAHHLGGNFCSNCSTLARLRFILFCFCYKNSLYKLILSFIFKNKHQHTLEMLAKNSEWKFNLNVSDNLSFSQRDLGVTP